MKISIVTISYNEVSNIEKTLCSVLNQTYPDIEYVVIDGGSTDGTADIIAKYAERLSFWCSEKDGGLYFGMNKGLDHCTGDYVIFCNAGDSFATLSVIENMVNAAEKDDYPDLVFGDAASEINGQLMVRTAHGPDFIRFGMPACHEAMMYKLTLVRSLNLHYDITYRIAADYKFTYQFVNASKTFSRVSLPIIIFSDGGISTANKWKGLFEACRVRKEVGNLSFAQRSFVRFVQSCALLVSTYASPFYKMIRLKKQHKIMQVPPSTS